MKIKAKNGTLERIPGGLNKDIVNKLMAGEEVSVDEVPYKLIDLVDIVENKQKSNKNKEAK